MSKRAISKIVDLILESGEGELSKSIREKLEIASGKESEKEFEDLVMQYKGNQKDLILRPKPIGRPKGQSTRTIQRLNWIRDKYYVLQKKRLGSTLAEKASLIRSEMKEKTPPFFQNGIYKKSTIIKILKNKSWGDD